MIRRLYLLLIPLLFSCSNTITHRYRTDRDLIAKNAKTIELISDNGLERILISPTYQGRVMSSTLDGLDGQTNGWINRQELQQEQIHGGKVGGEDRLWFGPLGSQFSLYYQQIEPLSEDNWLIPDEFNNVPYEVISESKNQVHMSKKMKLINFIGTEFDIEVLRDIHLLDKKSIESYLSISLDQEIKYVGFQSNNILINSGSTTWSKSNGLVGLWNLGMFAGSDDTKVFVPVPDSIEIADVYQYFEIDNSNRLSITNGQLKFKADGLLRSKFGIPSHLAPRVIVSYAANRNLLTIVQYQKTPDSLYHNGHVTTQNDPYTGEIVTSYNNGPIDQSIAEERTFYELESLSAMRELKPGDSLRHFHRTIHLQGSHATLADVALQLGIRIDD